MTAPILSITTSRATVISELQKIDEVLDVEYQRASVSIYPLFSNSRRYVTSYSSY